MARTRTPEEVRAALEVQRQALVASCRSYDNGNQWEALRLAVAVYVVVHDASKRSVSILTQLGVKRRLNFKVTSSHIIDGKNLLRDTPLLSIKIYGDGRGEYLPLCDGDFSNFPAWDLSFLEWWERDLIFKDGPRFALTRKKLVFNLRSVEGGAHYDKMVLDPNYLRLSQEQITSVAVGRQGSMKAVLGAELATMRQVAWELLTTLEQV